MTVRCLSSPKFFVFGPSAPAERARSRGSDRAHSAGPTERGRSRASMGPKPIDGKAAAAAKPGASARAKTAPPSGMAGPPKKPAASRPSKVTHATRPRSAPTRPKPSPSRDAASTRSSDDSSKQKSTSPAARWPRPKSSQRRGSGTSGRQPRPVSASKSSPIHPSPSDAPELPSLTVMPAACEWLRCSLLAPAWVAVRLGVVTGPEGRATVRLAAGAIAGAWGSCRADAACHPAAPAWLRRRVTPSCASDSGGDGSIGVGTGDPDDEESSGAAGGGAASESPLSSVELHALRLLFKGCDAVAAQLLPPARPGAHGARAEHVLVCQLV